MLARSGILGLTCALSFSTIAAGEPAPIDTEQKAAQAILFADQLMYVAPGLASIFSNNGLIMGEGARRALLAATTPAALARMPDGITLDCLRGGNFTARSSRSAPRDIYFEFRDCRPYMTLPAVGNGPLHLTLLSDSFEWEQLAGMRAGDAGRDLVVTLTYESPESTLIYTWGNNAVLQGRFAWGYQAEADGIPDRSFYEVNGTASNQTRSERPGHPPSITIVSHTADQVKVSGSYTADNDFNYEESQTTYLSGVITEEVGPLAARYTTTYDFAGLSLGYVLDYLAYTELRTIDGGIRYTNVNVGRPSCQNGEYLFRTKVPLHRPNLDLLAHDTGELVINRSVNARMYSADSVPAGLPVPVNGMLVRVDVANVGIFDYDVESIGWIPAIGQCF